MAFARAFCDIFENIKAHKVGPPELPAAGVPPALETMQMEWFKDDSVGLWDYADIGELFSYLRGSTKLKIPDHYRAIVPNKI